MTDFDDDAAFQRRTLGWRLGIVAPNLILPGLGLLRLNRKGPAAMIIILQLVVGRLFWWRFAYGPVFTFASWALTMGTGIIAFIALYGVSTTLTWRESRILEVRSGWIWRWYGLLGVWLGAVVLSPSFESVRKYYSPFYIPSESMLPVLRVHDYLLAQMHITTPLQRGELVIVHTGGLDYIKRIVALPGDKVAMVAGQIVLGSQPVAQRKVGTISLTYGDGVQSATVYEEQLPGEGSPHQIIDILQTPQDDWAGLTLGPNQYVLLGDNRDNSLDSRIPVSEGGFGIVTREQIIGKALFRYWRKGVGVGNATL